MEKVMKTTPIKISTMEEPLLPTTKPSTTTKPFITIQVQQISSNILTFSYVVAIVLHLLPYEYIDGDRVPTVIFNGLPKTFQAFVVLIMFSFSGSFCAVNVHAKKPKVALVCLYFSVLFMAFALAILLSCFFWTYGIWFQGAAQDVYQHVVDLT